MSGLRLSEVVGRGYNSFWNTKKRYRVLKGGRASKKSSTTSLWYIVNMMKYPLSNTLVLRRVFNDHRDSTYAQLLWAINRLKVERYWDAKLSPLEIVYRPTGQKILFRGLDEIQSITSMTVSKGYMCWVWFEEAFQVSKEDDFDKIDLSIRGEMPPHLWKQITLTFNPWNEKHWLKSRFEKSDELTYYLTTTYLDNEFLDATDIAVFEKMKVNNPRRYNVEGLGNWGISEGLIYSNWEEREFDPLELIRERKSIKEFNGLDFGFMTNPSALVRGLIDVIAKEIFIFDEHFQTGMLNDMIARMLAAKGVNKSKVVADSAEQKSIAEIKRYGINIVPAKKGPDSVRAGIQFLQQFKLIVHPKCQGTILELNNYRYAEDRQGKKLAEPVKEFDHGMDALRYGVEEFMHGDKKVKATTSL